MKIALALMALLLLGGCAAESKKVWVPSQNKVSFEQAEAQCKYDIDLADAQKTISEDKKQQLFINCMKAKGWRLEKAPN